MRWLTITLYSIGVFCCSCRNSSTNNPARDSTQLHLPTSLKIPINQLSTFIYLKKIQCDKARNPINNAQKTFFESETKTLTKQFVDSIDHYVLNWGGIVKSVDLKDNKLSIIIGLYPNNSDSKYHPPDVYSCIAVDYDVQKIGKGKFQKSLYDDIINLSTDQKVKFSGNIKSYGDEIEYDEAGIPQQCLTKFDITIDSLVNYTSFYDK